MNECDKNERNVSFYCLVVPVIYYIIQTRIYIVLYIEKLILGSYLGLAMNSNLFNKYKHFNNNDGGGPTVRLYRYKFVYIVLHKRANLTKNAEFY